MNTKISIPVVANPVVLGKIGTVYGVRGWLKLFSFTEEAESVFDYQPWFIKQDSDWRVIQLVAWKRQNKHLIINLKEIKDRESAMFLTNCSIVVNASQFPKLEHGEYYWKDLLGCQVVTVEGYQLGEVVALMETGCNDVLIVKAHLRDEFGISERLIPFIDGKIIKKIDLSRYFIEVDWEPAF